MKAKPFLAVDGEACEGDYVLLCRTDSDPLLDLGRGGLHTEACLEFILSAPRRSWQVCFGLNYDVNNWLRDLPRAALEKLWASNVCYWRDYRIEWVPTRWLTVKHVDGRYAEVWEIYGFFQSSFVRALESWRIGAPELIRRMKAQRGDFRRADIADVTRYCVEELSQTVELCDRLREAVQEAHTVPARRWIGAGAIAASILRGQSILPHHRYDDEIGSEQLDREVVKGAYFGGRVELLRQGVYRHVRSADLKSAYPAAAAALPSLKGARLRPRRRFNPARPGIWRVRWDLRDADPAPLLAPFPVRRDFSIFYPLAGEGHYHGVEVAAALELGYPIEVLGGWVLEGPHVDERPFSFIPKLFEVRRRFAREGRAAEKALKLGLNSIYGKLAQGYGFNSRPPYQSHFWAGQVTASTRAAVLRVAARCRAPVMIATDGIFAAELPPLGRKRGLGSWERGEVDELFAAQPGVYEGVVFGHAMKGGRCSRCGEESPADDRCAIAKSRGFFAREVDYGALREGWEREGPDFVYRYRSRRFNGLGASLQRKDFGIWRRWTDDERSILLFPERKVAAPEGLLLPYPEFLESEPYKPKEVRVDERAFDQRQGEDQPMVTDT